MARSLKGNIAVSMLCAMLITGCSAPSVTTQPTPPSIPASPSPLPAQYEQAAKVFETYQALEVQFDPAIAALYAHDAHIQITRRYLFGAPRVITLSMDEYRALMETGLPLAKALDDRNTYSDVHYTSEGTNVRIQATRYSHRKDYFSPFSLLVGPNASGTWYILEEIGESQS